MYSQRGLVFYLNDHQTLFQEPFVQKHTKTKFPCFDQNQKKPMWRLWKIIFLQSRRACFLPQRSSKHYFQAHFVQEQTKRKFSFFDQNHGLILLKKIPILLLCKIRFLWSRRACFLTRWSWDIISRPILLKTKRKISDFSPKSWVKAFKKDLSMTNM